MVLITLRSSACLQQHFASHSTTNEKKNIYIDIYIHTSLCTHVTNKKLDTITDYHTI